MTGDWQVIVPGSGEVQAVAVLLLSLADDPADVRTQRGGGEFLVPPYLADRFTQPDPPKTTKRPRARRTKESGS